MPVHQFEYVRDVGWRERLVDVDSNGALRLVLARGATFTSESLPKRVLPAAYTPQEGELCEVRCLCRRATARSSPSAQACPDALAVAQVVAQRLAAQRGAALFVDYGTTSALQCSLRVPPPAAMLCDLASSSCPVLVLLARPHGGVAGDQRARVRGPLRHAR